MNKRGFTFIEILIVMIIIGIIASFGIPRIRDAIQKTNIRELEHAIERAAVLNNKPVLEPADLEPLSAPRAPVEQGIGSGKLRDQISVAEKRAIQAALEAADGNRAAAAKHLGVSLRTLFYKMVRHRMG